MRFAFFILCSVLASGYSTVASASSREAAAALANCAWERVPETAQALLDKRVKKNIIYDEVGNTLPVHAAPFMRVYAACSDEKAALEGFVGRREVAYRLLRQLKREKPDSVQADTFETPVFVCEARFPDRFEDESAAIVWWGFGEDRFASQLGVKATVFNSQVNITFADIAAIEKRGNGAANFANLLSQTEGQEVIEVETFDGGMASEKAFKITPTEANSKCKLVNARGELINA
jgi:hypothetical protein